jgi:hypothetical protein
MARKPESYMTPAKKTKPKKQKKSAPKNHLVSVVLLSENYGYRMKSCGPISLVKVGNHTLLEHQLDAINKAFTHYEIILCTGFETEKVLNFIEVKCPTAPIRVVENQIYKVTNCCESTRIALNNISNDCVVICNGELMLSPEQLKKVDLSQSCVLSQLQPVDNIDVGIIQNDGYLETMNVGLKGELWSEIVCLSDRRAIACLKSYLSMTEFKNKFLFEAIQSMCKRQPLRVIDMGFSASKINNAKSLQRVTNENLG